MNKNAEFNNIIAELEAVIQKLENFLDLESTGHKKTAQSSQSTQPTYIDSKGQVFTAARIVAEGFKPSGKIKGYSWSEKVNKPEYGMNIRKD